MSITRNCYCARITSLITKKIKHTLQHSQYEARRIQQAATHWISPKSNTTSQPVWKTTVNNYHGYDFLVWEEKLCFSTFEVFVILERRVNLKP